VRLLALAGRVVGRRRGQQVEGQAVRRRRDGGSRCLGRRVDVVRLLHVVQEGHQRLQRLAVHFLRAQQGRVGPTRSTAHAHAHARPHTAPHTHLLFWVVGEEVGVDEEVEPIEEGLDGGRLELRPWVALHVCSAPARR
jgi:hypothetical protein